MIALDFRFFGALRDFGAGIRLQVVAGSTVGEIKSQLACALTLQNPGFPSQLLAQSAIGNESRVLSNSDRIEAGGELVVLPPVCGG